MMCGCWAEGITSDRSRAGDERVWRRGRGMARMAEQPWRPPIYTSRCQHSMHFAEPIEEMQMVPEKVPHRTVATESDETWSVEVGVASRGGQVVVWRGSWNRFASHGMEGRAGWPQGVQGRGLHRVEGTPGPWSTEWRAPTPTPQGSSTPGPALLGGHYILVNTPPSQSLHLSNMYNTLDAQTGTASRFQTLVNPPPIVALEIARDRAGSDFLPTATLSKF